MVREEGGEVVVGEEGGIGMICRLRTLDQEDMATSSNRDSNSSSSSKDGDRGSGRD